MTDNQIRAGVDSYLLYGEETSYATEAGTIASLFGDIQSFTASPRRNLQKLRGTNGQLPSANTESTSRDAHQILRGRFEGSMSISFRPFEFRFLKAVFGTESGSGTSVSNYNYPQATASTDGDKRNYLKVPSLSLSSNYRFGGSSDNADRAYKYLGGKVNNCTITGNVGEPISVSLEIPFADVAQTGTLESPVALPTHDVYHFVGASLEVPSASAVANIFESFTLTITNVVELLYGLGSDIAQAAKEKERDFNLQVTLTAEGKQFLDDFYGDTAGVDAPTEIASIKLELTGDTNKVTTINLLRVKIDEDSLSGDYPNVVKETITFYPEVVYVEEQTTT